jgi:phytanoyl-CoA hydroxylase
MAQGMTLDSGLWIDAPDVLEQIEVRRQRGELSEGQAAGLRHFAEQGFLVIDLPQGLELADTLLAGVERLWAERPAEVAFAYESPPRRMSRSDLGRDRRPKHRLHDIHSHVEAARALYLDRELFSWMRLILGQEPVAIQSLFFEYGSQQVLHRDPVVVPTGKPGHLLASWIALEDIHPGSGALVYVPGSHRLPYYEFAPGEYQFDGSRMGAAEIEAATTWDDARAAEKGLAPRLFTPKKGQALLWHASLRHGGGPVEDERLTRKSFVVHYSTASTYPVRAISLLKDGPGQEVWETTTLLENQGDRGFDNPLCGWRRS